MVVSTVVLTGVAGCMIHTLSQSNKATDLGGGGGWGMAGLGINWGKLRRCLWGKGEGKIKLSIVMVRKTQF